MRSGGRLRAAIRGGGSVLELAIEWGAGMIAVLLVLVVWYADAAWQDGEQVGPGRIDRTPIEHLRRHEGTRP